MHIQNMKLFQNPAVYGNDFIIPTSLLSENVKSKTVEFGKFNA